MIETVDKIIKDKVYPQILLMFGEEDYIMEQAYEKLVKHLVSEVSSEPDFVLINADDTTSDKIVMTCNAYPFIAEKRVVAVNNFDKLFQGKVSKKAELSSPFANYLGNPQETTILILKGNVKKLNGLASGMLAKKSKAKAEKILSTAGFPYNILLNKYEWIEFPRVYENQYSSWVSRRLKSFGRTISEDAADLLILHTNPSLRDISGEIEKLLIYVGERKEITVDDISFLVGENREFNVYELQKAVGRRNLSQAIKITENMLAVDRKEMLIMTVLISFFTSLFKLIEESAFTTDKFVLAGKLGVSPMFVGDYLDALRLYSQKEIESAFDIMTETDTILKTSSTDSLYVIEKMLISIIERK